MTSACLRLASVLVVVARWHVDMDIIFIISGICCAPMMEEEQIGCFKKTDELNGTRRHEHALVAENTCI